MDHASWPALGWRRRTVWGTYCTVDVVPVLSLSLCWYCTNNCTVPPKHIPIFLAARVCCAVQYIPYLPLPLPHMGTALWTAWLEPCTSCYTSIIVLYICGMSACGPGCCCSPPIPRIVRGGLRKRRERIFSIFVVMYCMYGMYVRYILYCTYCTYMCRCQRARTAWWWRLDGLGPPRLGNG